MRIKIVKKIKNNRKILDIPIKHWKKIVKI